MEARLEARRCRELTDSSPRRSWLAACTFWASPGGGPWNARRLEWRQESEMDVLVNPRAGDRKVTTREDLESIVRNPSAPVRFLWIHERLVEDARRLWEANEETA